MPKAPTVGHHPIEAVDAALRFLVPRVCGGASRTGMRSVLSRRRAGNGERDQQDRDAERAHELLLGKSRR
ncbi:MAG TPA: hypothetical protein VF653_10670, partial [Methylomirabilota bacterium]